MRRVAALFVLVAACDQKATVPPDAAPPAVVDAAPSPVIDAAAAIHEAGAPKAAASHAALATAADDDLYYACSAKVGDAQVVTHDVLPHPPKGTEHATVTITLNGATRKLRASVAPHAGTVILMFEAYEPGDQKPSGEKLVPGATMILRLVGVGDETILYPEANLFGGAPGPSRCAR